MLFCKKRCVKILIVVSCLYLLIALGTFCVKAHLFIYCMNNVGKLYLVENSCSTEQSVVGGMAEGKSYCINDEFADEFSVAKKIQSYSLPFYQKTSDASLQDFIDFVKNMHFKTDHLFFVSLFSEAESAKALFEMHPEFGDSRIFDWLLYELFFGDHEEDERNLFFKAITNHYAYSHVHFLMDLIMLKHFYFQLEAYVSMHRGKEDLGMLKEIESLVDGFNKKMFYDFAWWTYNVYCDEKSVLNPNNVFVFNKAESILENVHRSLEDSISLERIRTDIVEASKLRLTSKTEVSEFSSNCILFYHFALKKQCFLDAVGFSHNVNISQSMGTYSFEIFDSKYVFFSVVPCASVE